MRSLFIGLVVIYIMMVTLTSHMSLAVGEANDQGNDGYLVDQETDDNEIMWDKEEEEVGFGLIRGTGRMLAGHQKKMTCDKYPRVCRVAGSPGRDCCRKKCVNVDGDRANCGKCGKKCKYSEACCKGKCVNVLREKKNCGRCGNKCKKGNTCRYGMCSYA
uniref:Stigma-specific Stig1 family protein n=1 Tax=Kalanchoe fedtschenkoi TaxID=63787 RepID=A0A7N0SWD4_KALFE